MSSSSPVVGAGVQDLFNEPVTPPSAPKVNLGPFTRAPIKSTAAAAAAAAATTVSELELNEPAVVGGHALLANVLEVTPTTSAEKIARKKGRMSKNSGSGSAGRKRHSIDGNQSPVATSAAIPHPCESIECGV